MKKLILESLARSFLFVLVINVLGVALAGTFLGLIGFLMAPGPLLIYGIFDVNNHDILPLIAAEMINVVIYSIPFGCFLIYRSKNKI